MAAWLFWPCVFRGVRAVAFKLFPLKGRVGVEVAADVAGEEQGLRVEEQADGEFFLEKRVFDFFLLSFLPGGEHFFASVVGEEDGAVFQRAKMFWLDLAAVDKADSEAVGEGGAKFFHEVEREAVASGAVAVEEADCGVESVRGERAGGIETEQGVEVGEEGVEGVAGRAAVAFAEGELVALLRDEACEVFKILRGGFAFDSAEFVECGGLGESAEAVREAFGCVFECGGGFGGFGVFACGAAEDVAGVGEFAGDKAAGERGAGGGVVGEAVLGAAQEDVSRGCADDVCEVASVFGEEGNGEAGFGACAEEKGAAEDIAETDESAEVEERKAQADFFFDFDDDGFAVFAEVCALRGDIEGVEEATHG